MLLQVENLRVGLAGGPEAVRGVSFELAAGDTLGLVGESGCGKSLTALALLGLLPEGMAAAGSVRLAGRELLGLPERDLARLRGDRLAMIFQEPMTALNPLHPVGRQVAEPLRRHRGLSRGAARLEAKRLLDRVGIPNAERRLDAYPHELSGGQRQRVMIAMALACGPDLLVADEPTTALDVTVQRQILDLLLELVEERGMALLLISHDLGLIGESVRRVAVMYAGLLVERGPAERLFRRLAHPYSQGLFAALPRLGAGAGGQGPRLSTIPGRVPALTALPPGCPFAPRCPLAEPACADWAPEALAVEPGHAAACRRLEAALARPEARPQAGPGP